jgi:hypothetical protein
MNTRNHKEVTMKKTITVDAPSRRGDETYSKLELEYSIAMSMLNPSYRKEINDVEIDFANSKRKSVDLVRAAEIVFMISKGQQPEVVTH